MKELSNEVRSQRHSLTPDELTTYLQLEIDDPDGAPVVIRLTDKKTTDWNGVTWVKSPFQLSGVSKNSSSERNRPSLTLPNEGGIYSYYINRSLLEDAIVTRYKAMPHESASSLVSKHVYYVSHPSNIAGDLLTLQLRRLSDANKYQIPPNRYTQPEFSTVIV